MVWQVYADGSSVAKRPTEVSYVWLPELSKGFYGPPIAGILEVLCSAFLEIQCVVIPEVVILGEHHQ